MPVATARTLYHGTLRDHAASIDRYGIWPSAGAFVEEMYGGEVPEDDMPELLFMADKAGIEKAASAMAFQIYKKLGLGWTSDVTEQHVRNHGALCIIKDVEPGQVQYRGEDDDGDHPVTVEPGDYYDEDGVEVDTILTGPALVRYLRRFGVNFDDEGPGGRDELVRLAVRKYGKERTSEIKDRVTKMSDSDVQDQLRRARRWWSGAQASLLEAVASRLAVRPACT
jgi:hypothetical protein